jgi:class 3 adenylate cyclase/predicted ATPase
MNQTLSEWLDALHLGQYAQTLADNEVNLDSMRLLDDADLRELGVPLGPRKILLRAIALLNAGTGEPTLERIPAAASVAAGVAPPAATTMASAQRRQLTVLFCDLVGSTALSRALDPEDLRELMGRYQAAARAVIERYDGHIAQYLGDGVMVYFGWPRSHGDDARRALRAALDLVDAVARLKAPEPLAARIGVATGLVVVGHDSGGEEPQTAVGETPNLAARLQALAEPNTVVVAELTRTLAGGGFGYRDLGSQTLKGIGEPVQAFAVSASRDTQDVNDAHGEPVEPVEPAEPVAPGANRESGERGTNGVSGGAGPPGARTRPLLVGRDEEIGLLRRAWQQAKDGHGQVVLISGEPGIGKSALAATLLAQLREQGVPRASVRCSAFHTSSAMFPVVEQLRRVIGWVQGEASESRLARLEARLAADAMPLDQFAPSLAALLDLPLPEGRYPPLKLSPQALKRRINDDLAEWQIAAAERTPMVILWEDLHWADPSSLDYAALLIEQLPTAPLLLVLTARPHFSAPWSAKSHVTPITLNRLERPQIVALVSHIAKGKAVPAEVLEHIVRKTDGVPLFVEELTRTILTSSVVRETETSYELTGPLAKLSIPATLHESLMARLDRTPCVREVAQLGAVLGREFAYDVLHALGLVDDAVLDEGLSMLVADELLYQRGRIPRAKYTFKHALIQDAAYQSLLKRTRQHYHRQVAQCIEQRSPEVAVQQPELLAFHYAGAGMAAQAAEYWLKAIKRAAGRAAFAEVFVQVDAGMALLEAEPDSRERTHMQVKLQLQQAFALYATRGMGSAETGKAFAEAHALCERLGDETLEAFYALYGTYTFHLGRGEVEQALEVTRESMRRALIIGDPTCIVVAHRILGTAYLMRGLPREAAHHIEAALRLYDPRRDDASPLVAVADVKTMCLSFLANATVLLGYPDKALALNEQALLHAERLGAPHNSAFALAQLGTSYNTLRDDERGIANANRLIALADKYGFPGLRLYAKCHLGRHLIDRGQFDEGVALVEAGLAEGAASGSRLARDAVALAMVPALARAGRWVEAGSLFDKAIAVAEATGEGLYEARVHQHHGEFLLSRDGPAAAAAAEASFTKSLEVARTQGARWWELRTAVSLARLWHSQGKTGEARALLAPIHAWFTEGSWTRDLTEARELLDELG